MNNELNYLFYISEDFEMLLNSDEFIKFEIEGIKKEKYNTVGNTLLKILNNLEKIIDILEKSKKYVDEPMYKLEGFLEKYLEIINKDISEIICNELNNIYDAKCNEKFELQGKLKDNRNEINKFNSLLNDDKLYNKYYDDLIEESKKRIEKMKIDNEKTFFEEDFLNYLYDEKNNRKKGKKAILSTIDELKYEEELLVKEGKEIENIPEIIKKYISQLINTIINYKYFFDLYYGIYEENDLKNKDIGYFQSIFGVNFEMPGYIINNAYEENQKLFPLTNLSLSIYNQLKKQKKDNVNEIYYKKLLSATNELKKGNNIIYLKGYRINTLRDILNVYFEYFLEKEVCIKRCNNCGKYFIPLNRTDEKYCNDSSPQNPDKTCKEYGAKKKYREEIKSRPLKNEHNRTMQFYRMRINRAKDEREKEKLIKKFEKYKSDYNKNKEQYNNGKGKLKEQDFIEWIISQKK